MDANDTVLLVSFIFKDNRVSTILVLWLSGFFTMTYIACITKKINMNSYFYTRSVEQVVRWQLIINEFSDQLDRIVFFVQFRFFVFPCKFAHQVFIYNFLATPWMSSWLNCIGIVIVVLGYFDLMGFGSRKRKNISLILFVFSTSFIYLPLIFNKAVMLVLYWISSFILLLYIYNGL